MKNGLALAPWKTLENFNLTRPKLSGRVLLVDLSTGRGGRQHLTAGLTASLLFPLNTGCFEALHYFRLPTALAILSLH